MALPTLRKGWRFGVNQLASGSLGDLLVAIKDAFLAGGFTVAGSSNAVAAGMDGVDRWASDADILAIATADIGTEVFSWIVLTAPFGGQLLISADNRESGAATTLTTVSLRLYGSASAAFAGGSTMVRPAAADQFKIKDATASAWTAGSSPWRVHRLTATDGSMTYVFITSASAGQQMAGLWFFGRPAEAPDGWTSPVIGYASEANAYTPFAFGGSIGGNHVAGGGSLYGVIDASVDGAGAPAVDGGAPIDDSWLYPNELTGEYPMMEVALFYGVAFFTETGPIGELGVLPDLWIVSNALGTGDRFPGDATGQVMVLGDFCVPWNGTQLTVGA